MDLGSNSSLDFIGPPHSDIGTTGLFRRVRDDSVVPKSFLFGKNRPYFSEQLSCSEKYLQSCSEFYGTTRFFPKNSLRNNCVCEIDLQARANNGQNSESR